MKTMATSFAFLICCLSYAQEDFKLMSGDTLTITDIRLNEIIIQVNEDSDFYNDDNEIEILIDNEISEIPKPEYEIVSRRIPIKENDGSHSLYFKFKENKNTNGYKKIYLKIIVYNENGEEIKTSSSIVIHVIDSRLTTYSYLGYIGTNFDLVDGIKASNLFFAANVFIAPRPNKKFGLYLSLYGNRTLSISDSISDVRRLREVRTDSLGNRFTVNEYAKAARKMDADNLGAYIAALIRLNKSDSDIQVYYTPSAEFIWRRNYIQLEYSPSTTDTTFHSGSSDVAISRIYNLPDKETIRRNTFDFNLGFAGILLNHENDRISVRLSMNAGLTFRNLPLRENSITNDVVFKEFSDVFFTGRAWITERTSGVTLQAEVYNTLIKASPYYGVTLSKAFDLDKLGSFFSPITSRK